MEIFLHSLIHSLEELVFTIPILYLSYLLVSYFSHNNNQRYSKILHHTNKAGPVIGAFLGCIPQCGFSSVMSDLYTKKIVSIGTLFAVFIATSDEAIPLLISKPEFIPDMLLLILIKFVYAVAVGYLIDIFYKLFAKNKTPLHQYHDKFCHHNEKEEKIEKDLIKKEIANVGDDTLINDGEDDHCHCENCDCGENLENSCEKFQENQDLKKEDHNKCENKHNHEEHHHKDVCHTHCCATNIFLDALKHTAIIIAYVFVASFIINLIEGYAGGLEPLKSLFTTNVYLQILLACLIGLIPNCVASVFLVELFMEGVLFFPAMVAGLCAGAGVGLIVLYTRNYKYVKQNILITFSLYAIAVLGGILLNLITMIF